MRIYLWGAAILLALAAAGCGSGGDSTEVALTKAQFIKRADAICRTAQARKTKAVDAWTQEQAAKGKGLEDWSVEELSQAYLTLALPPIEEASDGIAALTPPAGTPEAEKFVTSLTSAVEAIREDPAQAVKGAPFESADKIAQAYGFRACGLF